METQAIIDVLARTMRGGGVEAAQSADDIPTIYVAREQLVETCRALRDTPELRFAFLADIVPVDYFPREPRYEVTYLLASLGVGGFGTTPKRLRVRVRVAGTDARLPTLAAVWPAAGWAEREAYDLFGIVFDGHPDLRRILMPEDWEGYPLRKDYPVQINQPVKTYEPLQVSAEQFAANIEAARASAARKE